KLRQALAGRRQAFAGNLPPTPENPRQPPFFHCERTSRMDYLILLDGPSAAIVLGGTILGTVMRSGLWRSSIALRGLKGALGRTFDADRARSALAVQVQDIQRDGLL